MLPVRLIFRVLYTSTILALYGIHVGGVGDNRRYLQIQIKLLLVESDLSCSIKTMVTATKTLPIEIALKNDVSTVLMIYEMLLLQ